MLSPEAFASPPRKSAPATFSAPDACLDGVGAPKRYRVRVLRVTYRGKPLEEPLAVLYDKRRPLPGYAKVFCEMLAEHVRKEFPLPRDFRKAASARASSRTGERLL